MAAPNPNRWFHLTPGRLLVVLLAVEGFLWLSGRFQWFAFNHHKGWTVLIAVASVGVFFLLMLLWFLVALIFKWRFQYSLLSLLVTPLAVVIAFGWLAAEMRAARKQGDAVAEIKKLGGRVYDDYPWHQIYAQSNPPQQKWLDRLLEDDLFVNVTQVDLRGPETSDAALEHLKGLTQLQRLSLRNTKVSDAGVEKLQQALPKCIIER
jgi:hypothetical protein